jgi:hypothetical protein
MDSATLLVKPTITNNLSSDGAVDRGNPACIIISVFFKKLKMMPAEG